MSKARGQFKRSVQQQADASTRTRSPNRVRILSIGWPSPHELIRPLCDSEPHYVGHDDSTTMKGRRHTPEQAIRKSAECEKLLAEGKPIEDVGRHLEIYALYAPEEAPGHSPALTNRTHNLRNAPHVTNDERPSRSTPTERSSRWWFADLGAWEG